LRDRGLVKFDCLPPSYEKKEKHLDKIKELDKRGMIELDTKHMFSNQWNTPETSLNLRVFDWFEYIYPNKSIKEGYYLIITDEIKELRKEIFKCGYCGKQYHGEPENEFCMACLDSEYLTKENLFLLRIKNMMDNKNRIELTEEEEKLLIPLYTEAQIKGSTEKGKKRIEEERQYLLKERDKIIKNANTEYDGLIWLMDRGIKTDNVIYYDHEGKFCFGWRNKLSHEIRKELRKELELFPFKYEFK